MNAQQKAELQRIAQKTLAKTSAYESTAAATPSGENSVIDDIPVQVTLGLGSRKITLDELLKTKTGDVILLDKKMGDPLDVYVNNHLIAHGELIFQEEQFGVILTEILTPESV